MLTVCSRDWLTPLGTGRDGCLWVSSQGPGSWAASGRVSTQRNGAQMTHNPEVEGSNPSPATKTGQHVRRFTSFAKGQPDAVVSVICQWRARTSVRAFRLWLGTVEDQAGHGAGARRVHAGDDVAVDVQGDGDGGVAGGGLQNAITPQGRQLLGGLNSSMGLPAGSSSRICWPQTRPRCHCETAPPPGAGARPPIKTTPPAHPRFQWP
jgi:hypothetical protein